MGTFHDNLGELHGVTVVAQSTDGTLYVGRCHEVDDEKVILLDADVHEPGGTTTRDEYLQHAAKWGVFPRHKHLSLPRNQVASITPLGQMNSK